MKKFIFIAAATLIAGSIAANAQDKRYKPEAKDFSLELNWTPGTTASSFSIPEYGVKGRYFLSDKFAVKLNLGFTTDSDNKKTYVTNPDNSVTTTENKSSSTIFRMMPGVEYHFGKFSRISPYVGAGIGFKAGSSTEIKPNTDGTTTTTSPIFGFGLQISTGVDIYLCQGLYTGIDLGLGYEFYKQGRGKVTTVASGTTTEADGTEENISNSFGFYATPQLRIGWFF